MDSSFDLKIAMASIAIERGLSSHEQAKLVQPHQEESTKISDVSLGLEHKAKLGAETVDLDFDDRELEPLDWLCHGHLLSGYLSMLAAGGGTGKSIFSIQEAISIALGKPLLNLGSVKQGNVLMINNEDDLVVQKSRIAAVCKQFCINPSELNNKLFFISGYIERIVIAEKNVEGLVSMSVHAEMLIDFIEENNIKFLVIDPFISTHDFSENDNLLINQVASIYKYIIGKTKVANRLIHHTRKENEKGGKSAGNIDMARGASSLKDACRVAHSLTNIDQAFADKYGIDKLDAHRIVRLDDTKNNFSLMTAHPKCFYKETVYIGNGEAFGVLRPYELQPVVVSKEEEKIKRKYKCFNAIARAALTHLSNEGGHIKATEIRAEYMLINEVSQSTADGDFSLLPRGSTAGELLKINGTSYKMWQVKAEGKTAPRYIYIQPEY